MLKNVKKKQIKTSKHKISGPKHICVTLFASIQI